ncbi:hypothetical protein CTI12_AA346200 [Artemisia annua]|uniref:Uncharacterized protein n=1 Tax=Artemisia annua TaxID=35608 RepID=A0A2U1LSC5_ARTAN|nr:hypothetical protein CTI12_AA346200 [Artemisia annua]
MQMIDRTKQHRCNQKVRIWSCGFGKRTTVPSLIHKDEDVDAQKDKNMRPLVPIDYSTKDLQAVRETTPFAPSSNLAAAAEFAKRIEHANTKEERPDSEREHSRRSHDKSGHRDRDRRRLVDPEMGQERKKM